MEKIKLWRLVFQEYSPSRVELLEISNVNLEANSSNNDGIGREKAN